MSLIEIFKIKSKMILFTTPSHSQNFFVFNKFRQFYKYDISETDFHDPQRALRLAQEKASKIYGTQSTFFLTNGSTSGIIAAVLASVKTGDKVLIWDRAHQSHFNAIKLAGAIPEYYQLNKNFWGIYEETPLELIEDKLKKEKIQAVIITSPTYEGVISEIKKIKEVCKKYGAYLIVDEAHGALYPFCDKLPTSAIEQGADFVIQSLHKTAGGLNPTALLHCNTVSRNLNYVLDLITTTSPSYPLLATIEKNINYLNSKNGRNKILKLIENIENLKNNLPNCDFFQSEDLTKILVKSNKMNGFELSEYLFKNNIEDEKTNEKSTMLLCGIGTDFKKLQKLENVLKKV